MHWEPSKPELCLKLFYLEQLVLKFSASPTHQQEEILLSQVKVAHQGGQGGKGKGKVGVCVTGGRSPR